MVVGPRSQEICNTANASYGDLRCAGTRARWTAEIQVSVAAVATAGGLLLDSASKPYLLSTCSWGQKGKLFPSLIWACRLQEYLLVGNLETFVRL